MASVEETAAQTAVSTNGATSDIPVENPATGEIVARVPDMSAAEVAEIDAWLADPSPNIRRAVTEGLRIWTSKPYFRDHPDTAIKLLSQLREVLGLLLLKKKGGAMAPLFHDLDVLLFVI